MKKIIAIILVLVLLSVSLISCKKECSHCHGTGTYVCPRMLGGSSYHGSDCYYCNGKITLECYECNGTGIDPEQ